MRLQGFGSISFNCYTVVASIKNSARTKAQESIRKNWSFVMRNESYVDVSSEFITSNLAVEIDYMDSCGEPTNPSDTGMLCDDLFRCDAKRRIENAWNFAYLKLYIKNIPSQSIEGQIVGAVLAGDSILLKKDSSQTVTQSMPYFRSWIHAGNEAAYANCLDEVLLSEYMLEEELCLGKEVGEIIEHTHALFDSDILHVASGSLRAYEDVS